MGSFDLKKAITSSEDQLAPREHTIELYKTYSSKKGRVYVVLGIAINPVDKLNYVIYQELNERKNISILPLATFGSLMTVSKT